MSCSVIMIWKLCLSVEARCESRLGSQSIVSYDIFLKGFSEQELEEPDENAENSGFGFFVSFISFIFEMLHVLGTSDLIKRKKPRRY